MELRERIKKRLRRAIDKFSGEHSAAAPDQLIPYSRGKPDENAKVVMARLPRPPGRPKASKASKEKGER